MTSLNSLFKVIEIEINHHCNLRCSYCPNSKTDTNSTEEMSLDTFELIVKQLKNVSYDGDISLSFYNEPLLCSQLDQFISIIRTNLSKCRIVLYSNGTLLDSERFNKLYELGVGLFVITKHEEVDVFEFDAVFESLSSKQRESVTYQHHTELRKTNRAGSVKGFGPDSIPALLPCYIPNFMTTVTLEGDVLYCFDDYYKSNIMGNVHETALDEIWNSEHYLKIRKDLKHCLRHKYELCSNCNRLSVLEENFTAMKGDD